MRNFLLLAMKGTISAALLFVAFRNIDLSSMSIRLQQADIGWLCLAFLALFVQTFLIAFRWQLISAFCEVSITFARTCRFTWIGTFFNQTLPSSVGGDAVKILLLRQDGASWTASSYSVLLDRIIGLFALSAMVVSSMWSALTLITNPIARLTLVMMGIGTVSGFVLFLLARYVRHSSLTRWSVVRHLMQLSTLAGDILFSIKTGILVALFSIAIQVLAVLTAWCLGASVHVSFDLLHAFVLIPPVILISILPISIAGWGLRETSLALAFSYAGLSQADGVLVSLLFGASLVANGAIGGIIWLVTPNAAPR
jgi:glycosyltransferase 2 family protein